MQKALIPSEILLRCPCPPDCKCGDKNPYQWRHESCKTSTYINDEGDLYCDKYKNDSNQCSKYFIQHAQFRCSDNSTLYKYKTIADFMMALAQGMKAAELKMSDKDSQQFIMKLTQKVAQKWAY